MEENGFSITTEDHRLTMIKDDLGIQPKFRSCHTGVSEVVFEGHVPSKYVTHFF